MNKFLLGPHDCHKPPSDPWTVSRRTSHIRTLVVVASGVVVFRLKLTRSSSSCSACLNVMKPYNVRRYQHWRRLLIFNLIESESNINCKLDFLVLRSRLRSLYRTDCAGIIPQRTITPLAIYCKDYC